MRTTRKQSVTRVCGAGALLLLVATCLSFPGCASHPVEGESVLGQADQTSAVALRDALLSLGPDVAYDEAYRAATSAFDLSRELARQYRTGDSPLVHNILVNAGLRDRGLCYHWAEDMEAALSQLNLFTLEVRRVIARQDTIREHNAVVVTAPGQSISAGIVLDGWRNPGVLYWGNLSSDKYPWKLFAPTDNRRP